MLCHHSNHRLLEMTPGKTSVFGYQVPVLEESTLEITDQTFSQHQGSTTGRGFVDLEL